MNFKTMLQFLGISLLIYLLSRLFTSSGEPKFNVSSGSDCSAEFIGFSMNLNLKPNKKQALRESKEVIQKKICDYFQAIQWGPDGKAWKANPEFFIQGSYKHGTAIRTHNDICDIKLLKKSAQLSGLYTRWTDERIVLMVFNTNVAGFTSVLQNAKEAITDHPVFRSGPDQLSKRRYWFSVSLPFDPEARVH